MTIRPLIGIPSPRDIPEFLESIALIHEDKIWAKYYYEYDAYCIIRNFFLEHKEYTHLVIIPDDLIVTRNEFEWLRLGSEIGNYPILSGTCNLSCKTPDLFICQKDYEDLNTECGRSTRKELDSYRKNPIQQMSFEGFACPFIRRDIVEKIPFGGVFALSWFDLGFARTCHDLHIPLMVDTSVRMFHLSMRHGYYERENWGVDVYKPKIKYEQILKEKYEWLKSA